MTRDPLQCGEQLLEPCATFREPLRARRAFAGDLSEGLLELDDGAFMVLYVGRDRDRLACRRLGFLSQALGPRGKRLFLTFSLAALALQIAQAVRSLLRQGGRCDAGKKGNRKDRRPRRAGPAVRGGACAFRQRRGLRRGPPAAASGQSLRQVSPVP